MGTFSTDVLQEALRDSDDNGLLSYTCDNCHLSLFSKEKVDTCIFCGHALNVSDEKIDTNGYSYFLPFNVEKEKAIKAYKRKVLFNPIIPLVFKNRKVVNNITAVYIPACLVDINVNGDVIFIAGDKINTLKDGKNVEEIKKYNVKNYNNFDYRNVFICLWSKINDFIFQKVFTYDYSNLQKVDLNRFEDIIINSDLDQKEELLQINTKIVNKSLSVIRTSVSHELKKVSENGLQTNLNDYKKVFVPVYYLNVNNKGKDYQFLMNGQNEINRFKLTFGIPELIVSSLVIFLIIFGISFLLASLL